jgi:spermidine synthase
VLPGERNLFLASNDLDPGAATAASLAARLAERGVTTRLITGAYLDWLFDPTQLKWFRDNVKSAGVVNSDLVPYLPARQLFHVTATFNPALKPVMERLGTLSAKAVIPWVLALSAAAALLALARPRTALPWLIATSGCAAMVLELVLMLLFQLVHGAMIQTVGLLIALFMAGLWCGSMLAATCRSHAGDRRWLAFGEAGFILLCALLMVLFSREGFSMGLSPVAAYALILPLLVVSGICTGVQFPAAARLMGGEGSRGAACIYAFDLFGGCVGGIAGGLLLLPLFGLADTVLLVLLLKAGSFLVLQISAINGRLVK